MYRIRKVSLARLAATTLLAAALPAVRPAVASAAPCKVLLQTTSRNDETLDRIREKAREKIGATKQFQLVTGPAVADVTVETNGFPVKGRPGGTAMSAMILAGQHSNLNLQVLLSSFVGIYANGQEEAGADAIVAALEKTVTDRGPDLCPNVP